MPATLIAALGSLALLLCIRNGAPAWTLFASYAAIATTPNLGGMSRARWAHLLKDDPEALHTANSFEQAVDELCFMLGPVLAVFLCGAFFPEAGTLAGAVLLATGVLLFAAQRSTEPPVAERAGTKGRSLLRVPGMPPLLAVCLAMGVVFGAMEVANDSLRGREGSPLGGRCDARSPGGRFVCVGPAVRGGEAAGAARKHYAWCVAAMTALLTLPLLAASVTGSLWALAGALPVAGMATAPTMATGMTLVQRHTPRGRLNEGMTLAVTGLLGGIAAGSALGGRLAEQASATAGFGVPAAASAVALVIAPAWARRPDRFPGSGQSNRFRGSCTTH